LNLSNCKKVNRSSSSRRKKKCTASSHKTINQRSFANSEISYNSERTPIGEISEGSEVSFVECRPGDDGCNGFFPGGFYHVNGYTGNIKLIQLLFGREILVSSSDCTRHGHFLRSNSFQEDIEDYCNNVEMELQNLPSNSDTSLENPTIPIQDEL